MPELPEVETVKRDLEKLVLGKRILEVYVHNPAVIRYPDVNKFKKELKGVVIKNLLRRAKVLVFALSNNKFLVVHLKMTGQLVVRQNALTANPEQAPHDMGRVEGLVYPGDGSKSRVSFYLSGGKILDFNDQRMFGELRLLDDWKSLEFIKNLGPEPFDLNLEEFKHMLSLKKTKIKPLLMDQTFISGIGNLYVAEILFRTKINPEKPAQGLVDREKENLFKEMKEVLEEAIHHGGSSIDDYVRPSGIKGGYAAYHKVYGKDGQPCPVCKTIIKRISLGGRGTYFCPKCQS